MVHKTNMLHKTGRNCAVPPDFAEGSPAHLRTKIRSPCNVGHTAQATFVLMAQGSPKRLRDYFSLTELRYSQRQPLSESRAPEHSSHQGL